MNARPWRRLGCASLAIVVALLGFAPPGSAASRPDAPDVTALAPSIDALLPVPRSSVGSDDVKMAPAPSGRLFIAIRRPASTVIAGLDARGRLLAGWPKLLDGWTGCSIGTVASDSSVRLVCGNRRGSVRAFGFDAGGRRLTGWPVNVTAAAGAQFTDYDHFVNAGDEPRVVGGSLYILLQRWDGGQAVRLVRISPAGRIKVGRAFDFPGGECVLEWARALGSDGTAFVVRQRAGAGCPGGDSSRIYALGLEGVRPGWPVRVAGTASEPVVGPEGRVYLVRRTSRSSARVRVFEADGSRVASWSPLLQVEPSSAWYGAGGWTPAPPVVAPDGSAWLVGGSSPAYSTDPVTKSFALARDGSVRSGWPYVTATAVSEQNVVEACSTGGGSLRVSPVVGPGKILYLALEPTSSGIGGRIVALAPNGRVEPGWPVALVRSASRFRSLAVGKDGTVYALATEVERRERVEGCPGTEVNSATIVALGPTGVVRYRRTVMLP